MGRMAGRLLLVLVFVLLILIPCISPASTQYRSDSSRSGYVNEPFSGGLTFEKAWTYNTNKPGFNACQPLVQWFNILQKDIRIKMSRETRYSSRSGLFR